MPDDIEFTIDIPIRTEDAADVKEAFKAQSNYQPMVPDGQGGMTPITDEEWVSQCAHGYVVEVVKEYLIQQAALAAKEAALTAVAARTEEVTAWFDARRLDLLRPTATPQSVNVDEDSSVEITLAGTDPNSRTLSYSIDTPPAHGTLTGTPPIVTYAPSANYYGSDSFTFKAANVSVASSAATVSITVAAVPDILSAHAQSLSVIEDRQLGITLTGTDPDNEAFDFTVVTQPAHGDLTGTAPNLIYTPDSAYVGADSFTFKISTATRESVAATISITVQENTAPVAFDFNVELDQETPTEFLLQTYDAEGDALTYTVVTQPTHGDLTGTAPNLIYTPDTAYTGTDTMTFTCNDGKSDSTAGTVTFIVNATP